MFKFTKPTESTGLQFWRLYSKWHSEVNNRLNKFDITHTQFVILSTILWCEKNNQATTQANIVSITDIDKMTLSKSLKQLTSKELVIKKKSNLDTRINLLSLTGAGLSITKQALTSVEALDNEFFGIIGTKKKDLFHQILCEYKKCL